MQIAEIPISAITISEANTRKDMEAGTEDAGPSSLADSIREQGLLSPVTVQRLAGGGYSLIAGQRRLLACKQLGWKSIPAIIRDVKDDTDATVISLVENVHRADMNPIDKAAAFEKIYVKLKDYGKVAATTGLTAATVRKYISLLRLAPTIRDRLSTHEGPAGIGTLSRIAEDFDEDEQEEVLDKVGGFKQDIQLEIIKRSGGDLDKVASLREEALEGAFDTKVCKGLDDCDFIPEELIPTVRDAVRAFKTNGDSRAFKDIVRKLKR